METKPALLETPPKIQSFRDWLEMGRGEPRDIDPQDLEEYWNRYLERYLKKFFGDSQKHIFDGRKAWANYQRNPTSPSWANPIQKLDDFSKALIEKTPVVKKALQKVPEKKNVSIGDDRWSQLHQGKELACVRMTNLSEIVAANGGNHGLPDIKVLGEMYIIAQKLEVGSIKGRHGERLSAIYFHIVLYNTQGGAESSKKTLYDKLVSRKSGAAVCFENTFLPLPNVESGGHLLVHQTLAPCKLCRAGYRAWAIEGARTIIVAFDEPYDNSLKTGVFIFSPTGDGFETG